jgi:hypothetical protein
MKAGSTRVAPLALAVAALVIMFGLPPSEPPPGPPADPGRCTELVFPGVSAEDELRLLVAKQVVARDAADGRRALVEAAGLFRDLDRLSPDAAAEPLCWRVIAYARGMTDGPPGLEPAVARLEAELEQARQAPGGLRLPAPTPRPVMVELLERTAAYRRAYQAKLR